MKKLFLSWLEKARVNGWVLPLLGEKPGKGTHGSCTWNLEGPRIRVLPGLPPKRRTEVVVHEAVHAAIMYHRRSLSLQGRTAVCDEILAFGFGSGRGGSVKACIRIGIRELLAHQDFYGFSSAVVHAAEKRAIKIARGLLQKVSDDLLQK